MVSNDGFPLDTDWVEKIYQFAYKRTRNTEDAQDLSQEIIVQVLHAMNRGAEPNNFHAWVWSIARNHWYKYLECKRKETRLVRVEGGQITPYTIESQVSPEQEIVDNEAIDELSMAVSHLSSMHRQMIILYYLQEKSIAQIAAELGIPEGTVKRRLFDAKTKIKEGMRSMELATSRSSYAPSHVELFGGYGAPKHWQYLKSTLVRNILAASYDHPVSLEYLGKELGVASVYLEEELGELLQRGLVKRQGKGYVTNFVMFPEQTWLDFRVEVADAWEGLGRELAQNLTAIKGRMADQLSHGRNFEWDYLLWIFLVFACDSFSAIAQKNYARRWEGKDLAKHEQDYRISGLIKYADEELVLPEPAKIKYVGWSNIHNFFKNVEGYRGVEYANLYQHDPFPDRDEWIHAGNIGLLVRLSQQPDACLSTADQEQAAMLIKRGLLTKHEDGLVPTIPMIETAQWRHVHTLIREAVIPCVDQAVERVATLADSMLLPKVRKDLWEHYVSWIMVVCLSPLTYVLYQGREEGLLQLPEDYTRAPHGLYLRLDQ